MRITELLPNLLLIEPKVFEDHRGHFFESYRQDALMDYGNPTFVQDNQSLSHAGILRGLHFQREPHAQGKFVRVITGAVLDVALDIRRSSPTYGQFVAEKAHRQQQAHALYPTRVCSRIFDLRRQYHLYLQVYRLLCPRI